MYNNILYKISLTSLTKTIGQFCKLDDHRCISCPKLNPNFAALGVKLKKYQNVKSYLTGGFLAIFIRKITLIMEDPVAIFVACRPLTDLASKLSVRWLTQLQGLALHLTIIQHYRYKYFEVTFLNAWLAICGYSDQSESSNVVATENLHLCDIGKAFSGSGHPSLTYNFPPCM